LQAAFQVTIICPTLFFASFSAHPSLFVPALIPHLPGATEIAINYPLDVAKTRAHLTAGSSLSMMSALKTVISGEHSAPFSVWQLTRRQRFVCRLSRDI
jgi:hypothetical protein